MKKPMNINLESFNKIKKDAPHIFGGVSGLFIIEGWAAFDFHTRGNERNWDWDTPHHEVVMKYIGGNITFFIECIWIDMSKDWEQVDATWQRQNNTAYKIFAGLCTGTPPFTTKRENLTQDETKLNDCLKNLLNWLGENK